MRWEELTSDRFADAVDECEGVALVVLSVVERHGHHLPLGTDTYIGREIARRATEIEPAIIFPDYIFTQIPEARHLSGTIAIDPDLMIQLLDNVCRECARNGLKKVALLSAHGGNRGLVSLFNMLPLYSPRDYVVYLIEGAGGPGGPRTSVPWPNEADGHAGPGESSMVLSVRPDLVHLDRVVEGEGVSKDRLRPLREAGVTTGIWWYAEHPVHYQGDASYSTADAGDALYAARAHVAARALRAIKNDTEAKRLQDLFYAGSATPAPREPV